MNKEQQKQHLIDMMQKDEELGLYDIFNDEKRQGVKDLIDKHKQDDENYLDSFGVTKTQFEVYRNFNKQETLEEVAERLYQYQSENPPYTIITPIAKIEGFIEGAKWQQERMYSEEEVIKILYQFHYDLVNSNFDTKEQWFQQFKKK